MTALTPSHVRNVAKPARLGAKPVLGILVVALGCLVAERLGLAVAVCVFISWTPFASHVLLLPKRAAPSPALFASFAFGIFFSSGALAWGLQGRVVALFASGVVSGAAAVT